MPTVNISEQFYNSDTTSFRLQTTDPVDKHNQDFNQINNLKQNGPKVGRTKK
jgi:hypothetical protein